MFEHDSIADIPEDKLVEYLLAVPYWRSTLLGIYGVPREVVDRQRVLLNSAPGGQFRGDADIILCVHSHPEEAVAYQVKRIKVGMSHPPQRSEQTRGVEASCTTGESAGRHRILEGLPLYHYCG